VTGDEVRDTTFLIVREGWDMAQVDDLLRRVAAEIDAGRPVTPLLEKPTLRSQKYGYDKEALYWFLEPLRLDHRDLTGMSQDPWRDLAVAAQFSRSKIGHLAGARTPSARKALRRHYAAECWKARGQYFEELPGVRLRWQ
jgi:DivIVA domain-containing protein